MKWGPAGGGPAGTGPALPELEAASFLTGPRSCQQMSSCYGLELYSLYPQSGWAADLWDWRIRAALRDSPVKAGVGGPALSSNVTGVSAPRQTCGPGSVPGRAPRGPAGLAGVTGG